MRLSRRAFVSGLLSAAAMPLVARLGGDALAQGVSRSAYVFSFARPDGTVLRLGEHTGNPILIVNTATLCGYVGQYKGLQEVWGRYRERGLLVIAVPSNDFGFQEPMPDTMIGPAAQKRFGIDFPIVAKASVRGDRAHPFYRWAADERPLDVPRWNFHKYLVGQRGQLAEVFPTRTEPTDASVIAAIERELPRGA
jgi:glutathione peroxidase